MSVCTRKDGTIFVQWSENGAKKRKYFGKGMTAMVEAVRYNDRHAAPAVPARVQAGPRFIDLVNEFLVAKSPGWSDASVTNFSHVMNKRVLPQFGHLDAMMVTPAVLDRYVTGRISSVKATTICRELAYVRAILRWSTKRQLIPRCPIEGFEMPRSDSAKVLPVSHSEIEAILTYAAEHLRRAIMLAFFCGFRPGAVELLSIRYNQINWSAMSITVISAKKGGLGQREIPIHPELPLREWFEMDGSDPGRHIVTWNGKPVKNIRMAWKRAKIKAGVGGRKIPMYSLRHSFVSMLLRQGVDPRTIADMAGHDVATMMKHYAYSMGSTKVAAIAMLPGVHPLDAQNEK